MGRSRFANPALFICDIQEKFRPAIWEFDKVISTTQKLVLACKILHIPIYITTQNKARLGPTVSELAEILPQHQPISTLSTSVSNSTDGSIIASATAPGGDQAQSNSYQQQQQQQSRQQTAFSPSHSSSLDNNLPVHEVDKTAFSMLVPPILSAVNAQAQTIPGHSETHVPSVGGGPSQPLEVMIVGIESHICVLQTTLDLLALGHKVYMIKDGISSCNAGERPVAFERLGRDKNCFVTTSESVMFELVGDARDKDFKAIASLVKDTKDATKQAVEALCDI